MSQLLGIHHVTAIASDPQRNVDFYAGMLGLRLVKRTVNFDDPQSYHFYYGDEVGTPGGIMTFFPWPGSESGRVGPRQVGLTSFAVAPSSLGFWLERLMRFGVAHEPLVRRSVGGDRESVIAFRDPDGLLLEIVGHPGAEARQGWGGRHGIAPHDAIRGFHAVTLWVEHREATEQVLRDTLGFREVGDSERARRFAIGAGGPGSFVDVREVGGFVRAVEGPGTVHHVAFRVADDDAQHAVRESVVAAGLDATPQVDRRYFRSVYFREPGGVLFELATDGPGFTIDEPIATLGESLKLPPELEWRRLYLEATLFPIHLPVAPGVAGLIGGTEDGR